MFLLHPSRLPARWRAFAGDRIGPMAPRTASAFFFRWTPVLGRLPSFLRGAPFLPPVSSRSPLNAAVAHQIIRRPCRKRCLGHKVQRLTPMRTAPPAAAGMLVKRDVAALQPYQGRSRIMRMASSCVKPVPARPALDRVCRPQIIPQQLAAPTPRTPSHGRQRQIMPRRIY